LVDRGCTTGRGSLYTFTLDYWLEREMDLSQWRVVSPGDNLTATIYEFRPANNAFITLTQMSDARTPHAIASHLIPRRLGDAGVGAVFQRFNPALVDRYDTRLGVMLSRNLDSLVDT